MITKSHAKSNAYHHGLERSESQRSPKFQKRIVVTAPATKAASERNHPSGAHVLVPGARRSSRERLVRAVHARVDGTALWKTRRSSRGANPTCRQNAAPSWLSVKRKMLHLGMPRLASCPKHRPRSALAMPLRRWLAATAR